MVFGQSAIVFLFSVEKDDDRERISLDLLGFCPVEGCGGKCHVVVCVGFIEKGRYTVKNPSALARDEEYPLPSSILCANCTIEMDFPEDIAGIISRGAEEFTRDLKEARKKRAEAFQIHPSTN